MAVWLRHQEIEANKVRVLAQGFSGQVAGDTKGTAEAFNAVIEGMFPFLEKGRGNQDKGLMDKMEQEIKKGPLSFSPVVTRTLKRNVQQMKVPDEFKKKLQDRVRKKV